MASENDYILRLIDQTNSKARFLYKSMTKEQFNLMCEILNVKDEDWD